MLGAIILAGGPSSRFGKNKALIDLNHNPLITYLVHECSKITDRIIVTIGHDDDPSIYSRVLPRKVKIIKDIEPHKNPLNGITSSIKELDTTHSIFLPCDTPFISSRIIEFLFKKASDFSAVIPQWPNGHIEPLHAVYQVDAVRNALTRIINNYDARVSNLIEHLDSVKYVSTKKIQQYDPKLSCFFNINNLQDLELAKKMMDLMTVQITI